MRKIKVSNPFLCDVYGTPIFDGVKEEADLVKDFAHANPHWTRKQCIDHIHNAILACAYEVVNDESAEPQRRKGVTDGE